MRRILAIITALLMLIPLIGCSNGAQLPDGVPRTDYPVTVYDVTLHSCPQKVISLSPTITDIIIALGSDAQLIGVSSGCIIDRKIERFGSSVLPDTEKIIASGAQLVLATPAISDQDAQRLKDSNIPVVKIPAPENFDRLLATYTAIAQAMCGGATGYLNAQNTYSRIDGTIRTVKNKVSENKPDVILLLADGIAAADGTFADEMITFAGGKNVAGEDAYVSFEDIYAANPEFIFCPPELYDRIIKHKQLAYTDAVKKGNVCKISPLYFERLGENFTVGVQLMAAAMHPDLIEKPTAE